MDDVNNLVWVKSTENLEDILQNPREKLPQLINLFSQISASYSAVEISSWGIEQVGKCLSILLLGHHHMVDGELLRNICLDAPLMEFIFPRTKLKCVKIRN